MSSSKKINTLENKRSHILKEIIDITHMVRGSYSEIYRRCGKPNCWCTKETKGHPSYRITWTKEAKAGTKTIPKENITWIKEMTGNYKKCRNLRANLRMIEQELRILLDKREEKVIKKTEKLRKFSNKCI